MLAILDNIRGDTHTRRITQVLFLFAIGIVNLVEVLLALFFLGRYLRTEWSEVIAPLAVTIATSPYESLFSTITASIAASLPALIANVCYAPRTDPAQSASLNTVGYAFIYSNIFGVVLCGLVTIAMSTDFLSITNTFPIDKAASAKATMAALLSFHLLYLTQFLGLKPQ